MNVLSTINPGHRFFQKKYLPTAQELRSTDTSTVTKVVDNQDNFFTDLPNWSSLKKPKTKRKSKLFGPAKIVDDEDSFDEDDKPQSYQDRLTEIKLMRASIKAELREKMKAKKQRMLEKKLLLSQKHTAATTTESFKTGSVNSV